MTTTITTVRGEGVTGEKEEKERKDKFLPTDGTDRRTDQPKVVQEVLADIKMQQFQINQFLSLQLLYAFEFMFDFGKAQVVQVRNNFFYFTKQHARYTTAHLFRVTYSNISLSKD